MRVIATKEFRDALRNHWLQGYAALLAVLGLVVASASTSGAAGLGLQSYGRTAASLTNLCLLLAPLVALALGGASIAGERDRGTLERLLAQPLSRAELVLGKYLGLLASLALATLVGFLPAGAALLSAAGPRVMASYLLFPAVALLVIGSLLGLGMLISVRSRTGAQAQGRAVFVWFVFVLLYDLLLLGTLMVTSLSPWVLGLLMLLNPASCGRLLTVLSLEADLYLLGPAGAWLVETFSRAGTTALLVGSMLAWALASLALALHAFRLSDRNAPRPRGRAIGTRRRHGRFAGAEGDTPAELRTDLQRVRT